MQIKFNLETLEGDNPTGERPRSPVKLTVIFKIETKRIKIKTKKLVIGVQLKTLINRQQNLKKQ